MTEPVLTPAAAPVNVRTIDAREAAEREAQAGSLAPLNSRIIAGLIDSAVAVGLQITLVMVLPHFAGQPAWLVEYVVRCKPADARELLTGARERCSNDWLAPWLDLYLNRNQ